MSPHGLRPDSSDRAKSRNLPFNKAFPVTVSIRHRDPQVVPLFHKSEAGIDPYGENVTVATDAESPAKTTGTQFFLHVIEVKHYPPDFGYLLSLFPLTMAIKLDSNLPKLLMDQVRACIECSGPDGSLTVQMLSYEDDDHLTLEGALLPTSPGIYLFSIVLSVGDVDYILDQDERVILAASADERWAQGPLVIKIEENLFLGNLAAAADPKFLEERVGGRDSGALRIAVVNASEEREPRTALLNGGGNETRFVYRQFPFADLSHNSMGKDEIWRAVTWIHEQLKNGPVVVHCHAGVGRSASLIVAYLRLFRHFDKSYDWIVEMVKAQVKQEQHDIAPHLGLPETIREIQEDERYRSVLAGLLGNELDRYLEEPAGTVNSVGLVGEYEIGETQTVQVKEEILVRARVDYEGAAPQGVFVHTNLTGESEEILMHPVGPEMYQAGVEASRRGDNFWLTVSAATRRYDHVLKRKWIEGKVYFNVK